MGGENCFDEQCYETATLSVPAAVVDEYRNAQIWNKFINIQQLNSDNLTGDVNCDGEVNIADANNVIEIVVMGGNNGHTRIPVPGESIIGDVNGDGEVSIADINTILDIIFSNN